MRQKDLQTLARLAVIPTSDPIARRSLWQSDENGGIQDQDQALDSF